MYKKFHFIFLCLLINNAYAQNNDMEDYKIPYFQPRYEVINNNNTLLNQNPCSFNTYCLNVDDVSKSLSAKDINDISMIGKKFCQHVGAAYITLWFKLGAEGSVGIAELSSEAGIEVTFHCDKMQ